MSKAVCYRSRTIAIEYQPSIAAWSYCFTERDGTSFAGIRKSRKLAIESAKQAIDLLIQESRGGAA